MAVANEIQNSKLSKVVAVIGDGSMSGGLAFEGVNNVSSTPNNLLIILNDNNMSIDRSVGGMKQYLHHLHTSSLYNNVRFRLSNGLVRLGVLSEKRRQKILRFNNSLKALLNNQQNIFEGFNIRYFGPIDGHDINELVETLEKIRDLKGPRLLHIVTKKGKGLREAERNPVVYHAPGRFDAVTGQRHSSSGDPQPPKYQDVFGNTIIELAERNDKIVAITPAMLTGSSLNMMKERMPERTFDVGIAEQHAVTFAAGLAAQGMLPFCNIYSSFMQRAFDQVIHDVALQRLNVVMCLDRAGLVGDDGATHHGVFDIAYMRFIPGLSICAPMDDHELRDMLFTAQQPDMGPVVIRYPRGAAVNVDWRHEMKPIEIGRGRQLREGRDVAILSIGHPGNDALRAADLLKEQGRSVAVYDMRFVKPLDTVLLDSIISSGFSRVVTLEDGVIQAGFGSAVLEYFASKGYAVPVVQLGVPDHFVPHGTVSQLKKDCGFDLDAIVQACL